MVGLLLPAPPSLPSLPSVQFPGFKSLQIQNPPMPPRPTVDERLRLLREVRSDGDLTKIRETAIKYLADKTNLIIAVAARLIGEFELTGLEPELLAAWTRF